MSGLRKKFHVPKGLKKALPHQMGGYRGTVKYGFHIVFHTIERFKEKPEDKYYIEWTKGSGHGMKTLGQNPRNGTITWEQKLYMETHLKRESGALEEGFEPKNHKIYVKCESTDKTLAKFNINLSLFARMVVNHTEQVELRVKLPHGDGKMKITISSTWLKDSKGSDNESVATSDVASMSSIQSADIMGRQRVSTIMSEKDEDAQRAELFSAATPASRTGISKKPAASPSGSGVFTSEDDDDDDDDDDDPTLSDDSDDGPMTRATAGSSGVSKGDAIAKLQNALARSQAQMKAMQEEKSLLIRETRSDKEKLQRQIQILEETLQKAQSELEERDEVVSGLESQVANLRKSGGGETAANGDLDELREENRMLKGRLEDAMGTVRELRESSHGVDGGADESHYKKEAARLEEELSEMWKQFEEISTQSEKEKQALREELERARSGNGSSDEVAVLKEQLRLAQDRLGSANRECDELRQKNAEKAQQSDGGDGDDVVAALRDEIDELESALDSQRDEGKDLEDQLHEATARIEKLQSDLREAQEAKAEPESLELLSNELASVKGMRDMAVNAHKAAEEKLASLSADYGDLKQRYESQERELKDVKTKCGDLETTVKQLEDESDSLRLELERVQKEVSTNTGKLSPRKVTLEDVDSQEAATDTSDDEPDFADPKLGLVDNGTLAPRQVDEQGLEELHAQIKELELRVESLSGELEVAQNDAKTTKSELSKLKALESTAEPASASKSRVAIATLKAEKAELTEDNKRLKDIADALRKNLKSTEKELSDQSKSKWESGSERDDSESTSTLHSERTQLRTKLSLKTSQMREMRSEMDKLRKELDQSLELLARSQDETELLQKRNRELAQTQLYSAGGSMKIDSISEEGSFQFGIDPIEHRQLQNDNFSLKSENRRLESSLQNLKKELEHVKSLGPAVVEKPPPHPSSPSRGDKDNSSSSKELARLTRELHHATAERQSAVKECDSLRTQLTEAGHRLDRKEAETQRLDKQLESMESMLSLTQSQLRDTQNQLQSHLTSPGEGNMDEVKEALRSDYEKMIVELNVKVAELQMANDEMSDRLGQENSQNNQNSQNRKDSAADKGGKKDSKWKFGIGSNSGAADPSFVEEFTKLKKVLRQMAEEMVVLDQEKVKTENALVLLEEELQMERNKKHELEAEILEYRVAGVSVKVAESTDDEVESTDLKSQNIELREWLSSTEAERDRIKAALHKRTKQYVYLKRRVAANGSVDILMDSDSDEGEDVNDSIGTDKKQIELEKDRDIMEAAIRKLAAVAEKLKGQLDSTNREKEQLVKEKEALQADVHVAQDTMGRLTIEVEKLKEQLNDGSEVETLKATLKKKDAKIKQLLSRMKMSDVGKVQAALLEMGERVAEMGEDARAVDALNKGLNARIEELEVALHEKEKELQAEMAKSEELGNEVEKVTAKCEKAEEDYKTLIDKPMVSRGASPIPNVEKDSQQLIEARLATVSAQQELVEANLQMEDLKLQIEKLSSAAKPDLTYAAEFDKKLKDLQDRCLRQSDLVKQLNEKLSDRQSELAAKNSLLEETQLRLAAAESSEAAPRTADIADLQAKLIEVEKERDDLAEQLFGVGDEGESDQLSDLKRSHTARRLEIQDGSNAEVDAAGANLQAKVSKLEVDLSDATLSTKNAERERDEALQQCMTYKEEIDRLEETVQESSNQIENLQTKLQAGFDTASEHTAVAELEDNVAVLTAKLDAMERVARDDKKAMDESKARIAELEVELSSAQQGHGGGGQDETIAELEDNVAVLTAKLDAMERVARDDKKAMDESKARIAELEVELSSAQQGHGGGGQDETIAELEDNVAVLTAKLDAMERVARDDKKALEEAQEKTKELETEVEKLNEDLKANGDAAETRPVGGVSIAFDDFLKSTAGADNDEKSRDDMEMELDRATSRVEELELELDGVLAENRKLRGQIAAQKPKESVNAAENKLIEEVAELKASLDSANAEIFELQRECSALSKTTASSFDPNRDPDSLRVKVDELQASITSLESEKGRLVDQLDEKNDELGMIREDKERVTTLCQELEMQLAQVKCEKALLVDRLEDDHE